MQSLNFYDWYAELAFDARIHGISINTPTYRFWRVVYEHGAPPTINGVLVWAAGYSERFRYQLHSKLELDPSMRLVA